MDNTLNVAYYVLNKYENITPLKLQKLLYYMKAWGLVADCDLVDGDFEKWQHGPVNTEVYHKFKGFQGNPIILPTDIKLRNPFVVETQATADFILDCYAQYSAVTLSAMSHEDLPWKQTQEGKVISKKSLISYYSKLPFAKNFPFGADNKPFYPVLTDNHYAYIFDMSDKDTAAAQVYPSYKDYKTKQKAAKEELQKLLKSLERK